MGPGKGLGEIRASFLWGGIMTEYEMLAFMADILFKVANGDVVDFFDRCKLIDISNDLKTKGESNEDRDF